MVIAIAPGGFSTAWAAVVQDFVIQGGPERILKKVLQGESSREDIGRRKHRVGKYTQRQKE